MKKSYLLCCCCCLLFRCFGASEFHLQTEFKKKCVHIQFIQVCVYRSIYPLAYKHNLYVESIYNLPVSRYLIIHCKKGLICFYLLSLQPFFFNLKFLLSETVAIEFVGSFTRELSRYRSQY